jgi:hypothetical protein
MAAVERLDEGPRGKKRRGHRKDVVVGVGGADEDERLRLRKAPSPA